MPSARSCLRWPQVGKLEMLGRCQSSRSGLWTLPAYISSLTSDLIFPRLCLWLFKGSTGKKKDVTFLLKHLRNPGERWLQAERMLKGANLCQQAVPPAPLHLENVLLNGPQKCPGATVLIFDDLVQKMCVHYEGNYLCRKVGFMAFLCLSVDSNAEC